MQWKTKEIYTLHYLRVQLHAMYHDLAVKTISHNAKNIVKAATDTA